MVSCAGEGTDFDTRPLLLRGHYPFGIGVSARRANWVSRSRRLVVVVALLAPGIAVHVVAVGFPESGHVAVDES